MPLLESRYLFISLLPRRDIDIEIKPLSITAIQVYAPISNAEAAEVEQFYEDLQDLLELTPKKDAPLQYSWASLVAQLVKNSRVMQETPVQFLGQEDPLEKG